MAKKVIIFMMKRCHVIFVRAMSMVFSIIYFESFYEYFSSDVIIWIMHLFLFYE